MFGGRGQRKKEPGRRTPPPPSSKTRFLQALYRRATSGLQPRAQQNNDDLTSPDSTTSSADSSAPTQHASGLSSYPALDNLRRRGKQPQATVEVARPAPEVEFSRVSDSGWVPDGPHTGGSASLMSLRASQQGPGFSPRVSGRPLPSSLTIETTTALSTDSTGAAGLYSKQKGSGANSSVDDTAAAAGTSRGGMADRSSVGASMAAYLNDEWNVPFRANAVEIAAHDDRNECAFLAHDIGDIGGDALRTRSILPQLVGQLHPATLLSSNTMPSDSGRLLEMRRKMAASPKVYKELADIDGFNAIARLRVSKIALQSVMSDFARQHLAMIIRQLLDEIGVAEDSGWDQVVFDLALNAVQKVQPNVRAGDNMDLRRYVRIKRIPGGEPSDSQYVTGIVFTKNLAHRSMAQYLEAPRIMLLTLPLELSAPSRYAHFDEELRIQQGFTEKLVQRIADAAPDLVISEKIVPRRILEGLMHHRIAVAHGVKRSVIRAVARCTGADVVASMDRFSDYPRTGTCASIAVQTYEHESLAGYRKSFMFIDGCDERLGGTIVLRGESFTKLGDIKQVVDLVVCLAYSMYLEGALLVNEFALGVAGEYNAIWTDSDGGASPATPLSAGNGGIDDGSLALQALNEYNIVLSSSPCVRIPPPHVLVSMRERELAVQTITERFNMMSSARRDSAGLNMSIDGGGGGGMFGSSGVAFLVSRQQQQSAASMSRMRQQYESELALHESYIHAGRVFLEANPQAVSLWDYQSIVLSYMVTCRKHEYLVCVGPQYHPIAFYSHLDVTLGQYLEEMCFDLDYDCPGSSRRCTHPMYEHRRSYIHNHGRIDVTMDEYPCPIERLSEVILMWSECKRCRKQSPVTRMSDESWCYSFGKYLEITFYNAPLRPRATICPHDIHQDHVRCFALRNMIVRFEYSTFAIWTIATPTTPLYFNMEVSVRLKEQEAAELRARLDAYYGSLLSRLESFPHDLVYPHKAEECRHMLQALEARAATEQVYFQQSLEQTVRNTHPADTLVVVVVYEALQAKVVEWNLQFSELAQTFIQLDASNRPSAQKRTATDGHQPGDTSADGIVMKEHEIDSLEMIDELHSASAHHDVPPHTDLSASTASFAKPMLGSSPTEEHAPSGQPAAEGLADTEVFGMSRLHRRLSMEAMRREHMRQERAMEKQRKLAAEAQEARGKHQRSRGGASSQPQGHKNPADAQQQGRSVGQISSEAMGKNSGFGGHTTRRLIGGVVADIDDEVRLPRQTEFPELRGQHGKNKLKYGMGYGAKVAQPLFDIIHRALPHTSTGVSHDRDSSQMPPPSRIPGPRPDSEGHGANNRPLSSFGRPPDLRNSGIPRPPNIRGRTPSPSPAQRPASASGGTGSDTGGSNVFLRLAKRLNSARGQHSTPTSGVGLGTVPRKMNLLLPAAAQYISQHPRRPPMPQVQVFHTKPSSDESGRRSAPARRHSYQLAADQVEEDDAGASYQRQYGPATSTTSTRNSYHDIARDGEDAHDDHQAQGQRQIQGQSQNQSQRSLRLRAATVSQMLSKPSKRQESVDLARLPRTPGGPEGSPRFSPASAAAALERESPGVPATAPAPILTLSEQKNGTASRASSIIPSITRRLGLGFGFRSSASRNPSNTSNASRDSRKVAERDAGLTSDDGKGSVMSVPRETRSARRPIPPQLTIARGSAASDSRSDAAASSQRRRRSSVYTDPSDGNAPSATDSEDTGSSSSYSSSSSESSSEADIEDGINGVDDRLPYYDQRDSLRTPLGVASRSARSSYHPDSFDTSATQMDLYLSSPMRTTPYSSLMASQTLNRQQPPPKMNHGMSWNTDSEDGAPDTTQNLLDSTRRPRLNLRFRHNSSSAEEESEPNEPDLHFGQSDAGSDAEDAEEDTSDQEAKRAAEYLQSVIDSGAGDFGGEQTARGSSSTSMPLPLTKVSSFESGIDTSIGGSTTGGSGGVSASGDSTAAINMPQENMNTLWKTISNLLMAPGTSQLFQLGLDLTYPLDPTEHVIAGSPIIVREEEPSSIIAFTLMDSMYRSALQSMYEKAKEEVEAEAEGHSSSVGADTNAAAAAADDETKALSGDLSAALTDIPVTASASNAASDTASDAGIGTGAAIDTKVTVDPNYNSALGAAAINNADSLPPPRSRRDSESSHSDCQEPSLPPANDFVQATSAPPVAASQDAVIERIMLHSPDHHLKFGFTAGQTKFVCKVYYAAQFDALRRCNNCEDSYIESLSRCMGYVASGGKSGSGFLRTRDERFIIKKVQNAESDAFLKFAPFYFEHMYRTYRDVMLTVLAKIFGFCRVSYRNASTGKVVKMSVVIMENVFYERKCQRVFDLKGSERNRMVEETDGNAVLQDENLIKLIRQNPICIRQQTKRHLHDAIWNDTLFLSKMNVMDYSLLVGFDENKKELVVGIVDFIRTFTWDKKLESWVKEAGILGGGGKGPTIVSPKQYKNRFREAMERYFLMVPDKFFVMQDDEEM
ncbi:Mitochondrial distribution and morphology protein 12 [Coemansia sp. RSA 1722]|nr:Mitochondrial distribution and morphology protein 12 [Coemansia sp. RSA 1722]